MFKRHNVSGFQLVEAIFTLFILSLLFAICTFPVSHLNHLRLKDGDLVLRILTREQKQAFLLKEAVQINLSNKMIRVDKKSDHYTIPLQVGCQSNFENQNIGLTENGTWHRGGSVWCGMQTVIIGIGQSTPRI